MLKEGDKAPVFSGIDQYGKKISSADYIGRKIILFFYPKDSTPTCSVEARNLQNNLSILRDKGLVIIGVSADNIKSHKIFSNKLHLSFSIIADAGKKIIKDFDLYTGFGIELLSKNQQVEDYDMGYYCDCHFNADFAQQK